MKTMDWKRYAYLLLAFCLPLGFAACSDDDEPTKEPVVIEPDEPVQEVSYYTQYQPYVNWFAYNEMTTYYLWIDEIQEGMATWTLGEDPAEKVKSLRYTENDVEVDRWTAITDDYDSMTGSMAGNATTTYGYDFTLYWGDEAKTYVVAVVTMVYPNSPAEKAGLNRGSVIELMNGQSITTDNYSELLNSSSVELRVRGKGGTTNDLTMTAVEMYEDPVMNEKVFDCNGKKVGYMFYNNFTFESCNRLIEVCKKFKQEGVTELILDLRYNLGGYGLTQNLLASMLAPEAAVKAGELYMTEIYNKEYSEVLKQYYGDDYTNEYFSTKYEWTSGDTQYSFDTSDANIGLTKIYALMTNGSASASEALLVGLFPYMDIEIIGEQSRGKYCGGYALSAEEWFQDLVDMYKKKGKDFYAELPQFSKWQTYADNWGIYVMVSRYADKNGENPCMPSGLTPDVELADKPVETYPLGDDREVLLREALTRAGYTNFTPIEEAESRTAARRLEPAPYRASRHPLDGKLILQKKELPRTLGKAMVK